MPSDSSSPIHVPVMAEESLALLDPQPGQVIVDATVGAGGHAERIVQRLQPGGLLIALDRDPQMLQLAQRRLGGADITWVVANFADLRRVLDELHIDRIDAVLADLGIASDQLATPDRGFSFRVDGPLDMRINRDEVTPTAADLINRMTVQELETLIRDYGEERFARRIARAIAEARRRKPIQTTGELAEIVRGAVPRNYEHGRIDPATRTFQALRIAVNRELESLQQFLEVLPRCLRTGGRAVIISFHSLEDRLVKRAFADRQLWQRLVKKPLRPTEEEVRRNPRARSAKLRAAQLLKSLH